MTVRCDAALCREPAVVAYTVNFADRNRSGKPTCACWEHVKPVHTAVYFTAGQLCRNYNTVVTVTCDPLVTAQIGEPSDA